MSDLHWYMPMFSGAIPTMSKIPPPARSYLRWTIGHRVMRTMSYTAFETSRPHNTEFILCDRFECDFETWNGQDLMSRFALLWRDIKRRAGQKVFMILNTNCWTTSGRHAQYSGTPCNAHQEFWAL